MSILKNSQDESKIKSADSQAYQIEPYGLSIIDDSYIFKHANGGLGETNKNGYEKEKFDFNERLKKGRYTLNDSALALEKEATVSAKDMVKKLVISAKDGNLKMYHPNNDSRYLYGEGFNGVVRDFYEVTTYEELNKWLAENELLIKWRFPEPKSLEQLSTNEASTNQVIKIKSKTDRRNRLYAEIEEIENYKNISRAKIIEQLKGNIGKDGTCVTSVTTTNINWLDWRGVKQVTSFDNLSTWLRRQKIV